MDTGHSYENDAFFNSRIGVGIFKPEPTKRCKKLGATNCTKDCVFPRKCIREFNTTNLHFSKKVCKV